MRKSYPIDGGTLHLRTKQTGSCQVHDWPTDGLYKRLVQAMRDRHPKGIDVCPECLERALKDGRAAIALRPRRGGVS